VTQSPTREKSYAFALRIIDVTKHLQHEKKEYVLTKQMLRSGTSVGANVEEAAAGLSRKDFAAKLSIASKEARETRYWLRLLRDSGYIDAETAGSLLVDCEELIRMLTSSVKSLQESGAKSEMTPTPPSRPRETQDSKLITHNS